MTIETPGPIKDSERSNIVKEKNNNSDQHQQQHQDGKWKRIPSRHKKKKKDEQAVLGDRGKQTTAGDASTGRIRRGRGNNKRNQYTPENDSVVTTDDSKGASSTATTSITSTSHRNNGRSRRQPFPQWDNNSRNVAAIGMEKEMTSNSSISSNRRESPSSSSNKTTTSSDRGHKKHTHTSSHPQDSKRHGRESRQGQDMVGKEHKNNESLKNNSEDTIRAGNWQGHGGNSNEGYSIINLDSSSAHGNFDKRGGSRRDRDGSVGQKGGHEYAYPRSRRIHMGEVGTRKRYEQPEPKHETSHTSRAERTTIEGRNIDKGFDSSSSNSKYSRGGRGDIRDGNNISKRNSKSSRRKSPTALAPAVQPPFYSTSKESTAAAATPGDQKEISQNVPVKTTKQETAKSKERPPPPRRINRVMRIRLGISETDPNQTTLITLFESDDPKSICRQIGTNHNLSEDMTEALVYLLEKEVHNRRKATAPV